MISEVLIISAILTFIIIWYPEIIDWLLQKIRTKYLRPEVSILELLILGLIIYLILTNI